MFPQGHRENKTDFEKKLRTKIEIETRKKGTFPS